VARLPAEEKMVRGAATTWGSEPRYNAGVNYWRTIAAAWVIGQLFVAAVARCDATATPPKGSAAVAVKYEAPTLQLVGPMVSATGGPSTYFDGNLASVLTPPNRFADKYERYYYHSYSTSGWYWGCGWGWGYWGGWCGGIYGGWGGIIGPAGPQVVGVVVNVSEF
jgi:hypothetical protein